MLTMNLLVAWAMVMAVVDCYLLPLTSLTRRSPTANPTFLNAGGWGKKAKDYSEAELSSDASIESKPVESYQLQQQTDFNNRIIKDRSKLLSRKGKNGRKNDDAFADMTMLT